MRRGVDYRRRVSHAASLAAFAAVGGGLVVPAPAAGTEFGGGSLASNGSLVALRTAGSTLKARAEASPNCGRTFDHDALTLRTALRADGTFSGSATAHPRSGRTVKLGINGSVVGDHASGQLRLRTSTRIGRRTVACDTGKTSWQARAVITQPAGTAPPQPGASYYGTTSQTGADVPSAFELLVSNDGGRVVQSVFPYRQRCTRGGASHAYLAPAAVVAADGSFRVTESFSERHGDVKERFSAEVSGRFAPGGGTGSARIQSTRKNRRTGQIVSRCDTGSISWSAIL
jgi:hypothetical protein